MGKSCVTMHSSEWEAAVHSWIFWGTQHNLVYILLSPSIWWSRLHFHFTRSFAEPVSGSSEWGGLSSNQSRRLTAWSCMFCYCLCCSGWECIFTSQDHLLNWFLVLLNEEEVLLPTKKRRFTFDLADPFSGSSEWEGSVYQRSKFIKWSYTFCFCNRCISWDGIFGAQDHLVNQFLVLLNEDRVFFQPKKKIHNMIL